MEVEIVTPEDTQLLDASIEDVRNRKKTMVSKIDSVNSLMNEVEHEEKAAEQAKKEAERSGSAVMLKVYELMDMQQSVKKNNDMLAREADVQKKLCSAKMESLQLQVTSLLSKGDRSLKLLDEMSRSLEVRLTSAIMKRKSAIKKKQEKEASARAALAHAEIRMAEVEEESNRLKQEAVDISKLLEFLIDRGHLLTMLHGEISDKCQDVIRLKEELDQVVPHGKMSSSRKSSISASSCSSLVSSLIPCQPQPEPADSGVLFKTGSGSGTSDFIDDHAQSACCKQRNSVIKFSEADIKNLHGVADITRRIKNVKIKGKLHGFRVKIKRKLHANQMFAKRIKKVKLKGKLHGNEMFAKSIKKRKIRSKLHGNQIRAKSMKKLKIKGKRWGGHMCARSIKNLKIQGKQQRSQICVKCIKKLKINNKLHGNQLCPKSNKKVKIRGKQQRYQMCAKSIKKMKINRKQQGCQICVKSIKKVKITGLRVVYKRTAAADHKD